MRSSCAALRFEKRPGVVEDIGQVKHYPTHGRVDLQDGCDEVSRPTPHVNEERDACEVIGGGHCHGQWSPPCRDAGMEELADIGMFGKIREVPHAIDMVMG